MHIHSGSLQACTELVDLNPEKKFSLRPNLYMIVPPITAPEMCQTTGRWNRAFQHPTPVQPPSFHVTMSDDAMMALGREDFNPMKDANVYISDKPKDDQFKNFFENDLYVIERRWKELTRTWTDQRKEKFNRDFITETKAYQAAFDSVKAADQLSPTTEFELIAQFLRRVDAVYRFHGVQHRNEVKVNSFASLYGGQYTPGERATTVAQREAINKAFKDMKNPCAEISLGTVEQSVIRRFHGIQLSKQVALDLLDLLGRDRKMEMTSRGVLIAGLFEAYPEFLAIPSCFFRLNNDNFKKAPRSERQGTVIECLKEADRVTPINNDQSVDFSKYEARSLILFAIKPRRGMSLHRRAVILYKFFEVFPNEYARLSAYKGPITGVQYHAAMPDGKIAYLREILAALDDTEPECDFYEAIRAEQHRQATKYSNDHDAKHSFSDWLNIMTKICADPAKSSYFKMLQVAATATSALYAMERYIKVNGDNRSEKQPDR